MPHFFSIFFIFSRFLYFFPISTASDAISGNFRLQAKGNSHAPTLYVSSQLKVLDNRQFPHYTHVYESTQKIEREQNAVTPAL